jgi:hypothetical protein
MSPFIDDLIQEERAPALREDESGLARVLAGKRVLAEYRALEQECKSVMQECIEMVQRLKQLRQKRRDLIALKKEKKKEAKKYGDLRRTRY